MSFKDVHCDSIGVRQLTDNPQIYLGKWHKANK
jgi:hypothetical protein